jgi:hypothetical protein
MEKVEMSVVFNESASRAQPRGIQRNEVFEPNTRAASTAPRGTVEQQIRDISAALLRVRDPALYTAKQTYTSHGKVVGEASPLTTEITAVGSGDQIERIVGPGTGAGFLLASQCVVDSKTGHALPVASLPRAQREMLADTLRHAIKAQNEFVANMRAVTPRKADWVSQVFGKRFSSPFARAPKPRDPQ